jgi:thiosulfate dehydrogenase [quinone] large subunit
VRPYFYGADIVFAVAWATLLLAGPLAGGWPALDLWLARWIARRPAPQRAPRHRRWLALALGVPADVEDANEERPASSPPPGRANGTARAVQRARSAQAEVGRRQFIRGAVVGGGVMLVVSWLWSVTHPAAAPTSGASSALGSATGASSADVTAGATNTAGSSNVIAQAANVAVNGSATFTIPANGDPGVLVHLASGKFVAFDAACTHQGCPVSYDPASQLLLCPCHGAAFDPSQNAAVVQGPASTPLTPVPVTVDQTSGAITLN